MKIKTLLKKTTLLTITAVLMAFGIVGCGSVPEKETSDDASVANKDLEDADAETVVDTSELKVFRVGCGDATQNQLNDLAAVAQHSGYLEEELNKVGYTLQVTGFQGQGPEINAALMSGSLDAGNYAEIPALTSKASGADTTVVALSDTQLTYGILASSDDIKTVQDLEGKKIVVQQGTALHYFWEQLVAQTGIDADKVEIINSNVLDGLSLIQTGDADAIISSENSLKFYEKQGVGHLVEGVPDTIYTFTLFNFSNDFLEEAPEVAVAVNKALIRAYNDVVADPQILYDLLGERYGEVGAEIIESSYTINSSVEYLYPEFDEETSNHIHSVYDWLNTNSLLAAEVDVDTYFDSSYFQQAVEELGE